MNIKKILLERFYFKSKLYNFLFSSQAALGAGLAKVVIGAAHDLKNGENLQDVIAKR